MTTPCPGESGHEDQLRRMLPDETTEPSTTAPVDLIYLAPAGPPLLFTFAPTGGLT